MGYIRYGIWIENVIGLDYNTERKKPQVKDVWNWEWGDLAEGEGDGGLARLFLYEYQLVP